MSDAANVDGTVNILEDEKRQLKKFKSSKFSSAYISKLAILTTIAYILYLLKFNLPFMFPGFLEMQISELPALLAGFSMGPISGCLVIVFKCLLKFPLTSTAFVGEATDILLGIVFVLPASLIYKRRRDRKHALIGLTVGAAVMTVMAIIVNRFISIPFYIQLFFDGNFNVLLSIVRPLYANVTQQSFYAYYLLLGVLPFNFLRCALVAAITFLVYKRLARPLHWGDAEYSTDKEFKDYSKNNKTDAVANDVTDNSVVTEPEISKANDDNGDTAVKEVANSEKE